MRVLLALILTLLMPVSEAVAKQSLDQISRAVEDFLTQASHPSSGERQVDVTTPDRRLQLDACSHRLKLFLPPGSREYGNIIVGVRCLQPKPWKLYVAANVRQYRKVVVLNKSIARGEPVTKEHIRLEKHDISTLGAAYAEETGPLLGMRAQRNLPSGFMLHKGVLKALQLISRGDQIDLLASLGGIRVRMKGTALANGTLGERITAKNKSSGRIVEGVVSQRGTLRINM